MNTEQYGYYFLMSGKFNYIKAALDPFESEINSLFDDQEWYFENEEMQNNPILYVNKEITADLGVASQLILGVITFVAGWSANKMLDELYTYKLKPAIVNFFEKVENNPHIIETSAIEYQNMVWYKEHKVLVMVRLKTKSKQEIEDNFDLIIQTHRTAVEWIKVNGKQAHIHEYTIESNKVNIAPNLFSLLEQIQTEERVKTIKHMKQYIKKLHK